MKAPRRGSPGVFASGTVTSALFSWDPPANPPPRWLVGATFAALSLLLFYPLHAPYLNGDQDIPTVWALFELNRGSFYPFSLYYPSGLNNALRGVYKIVLAVAPWFGYQLSARKLLELYAEYPQQFRMLPRLIAMVAGMVTLFAVWRTSIRLLGRWSALFATAMLGTALMFVREHHNGMWDAPAAACICVALAFCVRYVDKPTLPSFAAACAATGLACAFRYNACFAAIGPAAAWLVAAPPRSGRAKTLALGIAAAALGLFVAAPAVILQPHRVLAAIRRVTNMLPHLLAAQEAPTSWSELLTRGLGVPLPALAALGAGAALARRDRLVFPLVAFVAGYGLVIYLMPLRLNRYALPLAAPLAILAAYTLHHSLPFALRSMVALAIVAVGLAGVADHLRLLATEDTRVATARWIRANVDDDTPVFMVGNAKWLTYLQPDAAWRPMQPTRWHPLPAKSERVRRGIVVTSQVPLNDEIPPAVRPFLERRTELVADFANESRAEERAYESPYSLPFTGLDTLIRPGPHIRVWRIRPAGHG